MTRRDLIASGTVVAAASLLARETEAADDKGPERMFEGESKGGDLQEAIAAATKKISEALSEGGVADGQATWHMAHVTGLLGGFPGHHSIKVVLGAHRSPPWKKA